MSERQGKSKNGRKGIYLGFLAIILLIILFTPIIPYSYTVKVPRQRTETYYEEEPYQVTEKVSKTLIDDKPTVPAGKYVCYRVHIDISGKRENIVKGIVIETAGHDISFYVFDQRNYNNWREGKPYSAYVIKERVESCTYSFVPDHSDYYYFVLDNRYSLFTNKVPSITAVWSYQETKTEYRMVEKTRVVTVYETAARRTMVSLFQILTGHLPGD